MEKLVLFVHVLVAIGIIGLILLQQGKGAEAGASFGSGASQTVFGSQGSGNFLSHLTAILATIFFITSFGLAMLASHGAGVDIDEGIPAVPAVLEPSESGPSLEGELPLPMPADSVLPSVEEAPEVGQFPEAEDSQDKDQR